MVVIFLHEHSRCFWQHLRAGAKEAPERLTPASQMCEGAPAGRRCTCPASTSPAPVTGERYSCCNKRRLCMTTSSSRKLQLFSRLQRVVRLTTGETIPVDEPVLCELARKELLGIHDALPNKSSTSPRLLSTKKTQEAYGSKSSKEADGTKADDFEHITLRVERDLRRHQETTTCTPGHVRRLVISSLTK